MPSVSVPDEQIRAELHRMIDGYYERVHADVMSSLDRAKREALSSLAASRSAEFARKEAELRDRLDRVRAEAEANLARGKEATAQFHAFIDRRAAD